MDREKVGVSYSGGGPRVVLEFGAVLAFVERGLVPAAVGGVSAGAIAAAAHAMDPVEGRAARLAVEIFPRWVSSKALGLHREAMVQKLILHRGHVRSLGDNEIIGHACAEIAKAVMGNEDVTIGDFVEPKHPRLLIGACDWRSQAAWWFGGATPLADALVASSAIPGVFPWRHHKDGEASAVLVDGGVICNQPLSRLALEGCGTIFAVGFSEPPRSAAEPGDALHAVMDAIQMMMHTSNHLEEEYVRLKLGPDGEVHRLLIDHPLTANSYDFTPQQLEALVEDARVQVSAQLEANGF